jgi:hypothetical protein
MPSIFREQFVKFPSADCRVTDPPRDIQTVEKRIHKNDQLQMIKLPTDTPKELK